MKCGLLGRKLGHSYSPQIHGLLGDYSYELFEKEPEQLASFLREGDFTGINVTKLESRPIPDREFEFMFYFDLDTSIYSEEYVQLMCELDELCEEFKYLGSYTEVI